VIAVGILSLIFGFLGFLTLITARNTYNLHQQIMSQESASKANQRLAVQMRNAYAFKRFDGDTGSGPFWRMKVMFPSTPTAVTTHTIAVSVNSGNDNNTRMEILYFDRELSDGDFVSHTIQFYEGRTLRTVTVPAVAGNISPAPSHRFPLVTNFKLTYRSEYRLTVETNYRYNGYAFRFSHPEWQPEGRFITECIAKNHFMDEGVDDYGHADNPTSSPASL
jgi:hypothetical protein